MALIALEIFTWKEDAHITFLVYEIKSCTLSELLKWNISFSFIQQM